MFLSIKLLFEVSSARVSTTGFFSLCCVIQGNQCVYWKCSVSGIVENFVDTIGHHSVPVLH